MKEYILVKHSKIDEFTKLVNQHLTEGWECQGGITVNGYVYYQAMIKTL